MERSLCATTLPVRTSALIPAYNSAGTVAAVVEGLRRAWPTSDAKIVVVDDGSTDGTRAAAEAAGAVVIVHEKNRGKGAALTSGMTEAARSGFDAVLTLDADGQHPPEEAVRLLDPSLPHDALILGVRDLVEAGAPDSNIFGNRTSNFFLWLFTGRRFTDTQCGLRRYPVLRVLALGMKDERYGFEAEVILRAAKNGLPMVEVPFRVFYPEEPKKKTHFRSVVDPTRIVLRVVKTVLGA